MQLKTSKLHFICHKNKLEAEDRKDRKDRKWRKSGSVDFQWGYPLDRKKPLLKPLPPSRAYRLQAEHISGCPIAASKTGTSLMEHAYVF